MSQNEVYKFSVPIFGEGVIYDCETSVRNQQVGLECGSQDGGRGGAGVALLVDDSAVLLRCPREINRPDLPYYCVFARRFGW